MAQLVASMYGVMLGGVVYLARGKIFTASIGSVDSLYPSIYIYICVCVCVCVCACACVCVCVVVVVFLFLFFVCVF